MITQNVLVKIRDVGGYLPTSGIALNALPGTPLAQLNNDLSYTQTLPADIKPSEGLSDEENDILRISAKRDVGGVERHTNDLSIISKEISSRLSASLSFARNTVNAAVRAIVDAGDQAITDCSSNSRFKMLITHVAADPVYFDNTLTALLGTGPRLSTAKPLSASTAQLITADINETQFLEIIKTNSSSLDPLVTALWSSLSPDDRSLYVSTLGGVILNQPVSMGNIYKDHLALLSYLYILGVKNGNHPALHELSQDMRLECSNALDYFAVQITKRIEQYLLDDKSNMLIDSTASYRDAVTVIDTVYKRWVAEKNGTHDAILAYMVANNYVAGGATKQANLYANPESFAKTYQSMSRSDTVESRVRANAATDNAIRRILTQKLGELLGDNKEEYRKRMIQLDTWVTANPYNHGVPLDLHALRVASEVLSGDAYDSSEILLFMRGYLQDNPTASPSTAATMAACQLVAKWICSQWIINTR